MWEREPEKIAIYQPIQSFFAQLSSLYSSSSPTERNFSQSVGFPFFSPAVSPLVKVGR